MSPQKKNSNMLDIIPQIPQYQLFRKFNFPHLLPINLTVSLTSRCNSKCMTCNIYNNKEVELSCEEFDKVFKSIGKTPYWITFSGGEPFLRKDIIELLESAYDNCSPKIINIPTNGLLHKIIPEKVKQISEYCSDSRIIINVSLDDIGSGHDKIRGVKGGFDLALQTYKELKSLDCPNLAVGIHTVISKYNVDRLPQIYDYLQKLQPDSYITELAEERVELNTLAADITPAPEKYSDAVDFLISKIKSNRYNGISKVTQAFRLQYYELARRTQFEKRQVIPCYAGFASAQIAPNGDVWMCCVKAESIGNLKKKNYDFDSVWRSSKAEKIRNQIKNGECYCPLANAAYTNMLLNWNCLKKVGLNYIKWK